MKDFIFAALPWVAIGLCLTIFFARHTKKEKDEKSTENYGTEGMSIGMCIGVALGTLFEGGVGIGISVGMLLGLAIGSGIPKNKSDSE